MEGQGGVEMQVSVRWVNTFGLGVDGHVRTEAVPIRILRRVEEDCPD